MTEEGEKETKGGRDRREGLCERDKKERKVLRERESCSHTERGVVER